jgi:DNA-binding MarR family transcriptional regulator
VELSKEQLLLILTTALECFRADFNGEITAARINTLLAAAQHPGLQQVDIANFVKGLSTSGISRNVLDWSDLDKNKLPGPDFLTQRPDPEYRRRNLLYVTPKGTQYLDRLTSNINKKLAKRAKAN